MNSDKKSALFLSLVLYREGFSCPSSFFQNFLFAFDFLQLNMIGLGVFCFVLVFLFLGVLWTSEMCGLESVKNFLFLPHFLFSSVIAIMHMFHPKFLDILGFFCFVFICLCFSLGRFYWPMSKFPDSFLDYVKTTFKFAEGIIYFFGFDF